MVGKQDRNNRHVTIGVSYVVENKVEKEVTYVDAMIKQNKIL